LGAPPTPTTAAIRGPYRPRDARGAPATRPGRPSMLLRSLGRVGARLRALQLGLAVIQLVLEVTLLLTHAGVAVLLQDGVGLLLVVTRGLVLAVVPVEVDEVLKALARVAVDLLRRADVLELVLVLVEVVLVLRTEERLHRGAEFVLVSVLGRAAASSGRTADEDQARTHQSESLHVISLRCVGRRGWPRHLPGSPPQGPCTTHALRTGPRGSCLRDRTPRACL